MFRHLMHVCLLGPLGCVEYWTILESKCNEQAFSSLFSRTSLMIAHYVIVDSLDCYAFLECTAKVTWHLEHSGTLQFGAKVDWEAKPCRYMDQVCWHDPHFCCSDRVVEVETLRSLNLIYHGWCLTVRNCLCRSPFSFLLPFTSHCLILVLVHRQIDWDPLRWVSYMTFY